MRPIGYRLGAALVAAALLAIVGWWRGPHRPGVWVPAMPALAQEKPYSCGAAALRMVLARYRHFFPESYLRASLGSGEAHGTSHERMVAFARGEGLAASAEELATAEALRAAVRRGRPTIVAIQAWGDRKEYRDAASGHYVVVAGYDDDRFFFLDPWDGHVHELSEAALLERWHDVTGEGTPVTRLALFFAGPAADGGAPIAFEPIP